MWSETFPVYDKKKLPLPPLEFSIHTYKPFIFVWNIYSVYLVNLQTKEKKDIVNTNWYIRHVNFIFDDYIFIGIGDSKNVKGLIIYNLEQKIIVHKIFDFTYFSSLDIYLYHIYWFGINEQKHIKFHCFIYKKKFYLQREEFINNKKLGYCEGILEDGRPLFIPSEIYRIQGFFDKYLAKTCKSEDFLISVYYKTYPNLHIIFTKISTNKSIIIEIYGSNYKNLRTYFLNNNFFLLIIDRYTYIFNLNHFLIIST